jgi:integrase
VDRAGGAHKAGREHRVPLSAAALAVLRGMQPLCAGPNSFVFPGMRPGRGLSHMALLMLLRRMNEVPCGEGGRDGPAGRSAPPRWRDARTGAPITAHGFRSTFRDWAGEASAHPAAVAEAALAHAVRDRTEAAYARGDLFDKRRRLMEDWAVFCDAAPAGALSSAED